MATKRTGGLVSRSYDSAAALMWEYYVANKAILKQIRAIFVNLSCKS